MDEKEIQSLIEQLKAQGLSEEEILDVYYEAFVKGEMDRKDLETLAGAMGYELDDDFKNDEHPDPIEEKGAEGAGELDEADLEAAKALEPGESKEEFEEKIEDMKEDETEPEGEPAPEEESEEVEETEETEEEAEPETEPEEGEEEGEESEEDEWEEANKYFRV